MKTRTLETAYTEGRDRILNAQRTAVYAEDLQPGDRITIYSTRATPRLTITVKSIQVITRPLLDSIVEITDSSGYKYSAYLQQEFTVFGAI